MRVIILFLIFINFLFSQYYEKDYDYLTSKKFQQKLDKRLAEIEGEILEKKADIIKLYEELNNNTSKLSANDLAKSYVKITKKLSKIWIDNRVFFNDIYLDDKKIVFEYLIKDDEKLRNNFKDEKFKNTIYKAIKFSQQRVTCNSMTPFLEKIFNNGYKLVYVYKFMSDKKEIFRVEIDKNSCKGK